MMHKSLPNAAVLRNAAEARLSGRQAPESPVSALDSQRLVHELQVHQIELEMQNEELGRAYAEVAALRDKYLALYDMAPVGYFTVGLSGEIIELNLFGATLLGEDRSTLTGRRLQDFVQPESASALADFLDQASGGDNGVSTTLTLRHHGREAAYVKVQGQPFEAYTDGETQIRIAMMDLTELKSANDELLQSFEKFFRYWRP